MPVVKYMGNRQQKVTTVCGFTYYFNKDNEFKCNVTPEAVPLMVNPRPQVFKLLIDINPTSNVFACEYEGCGYVGRSLQGRGAHIAAAHTHRRRKTLKKPMKLKKEARMRKKINDNT